MSTAYLKVKIKSLAAEASIIHHEERKHLGSARWLDKNARAGAEKDIARSTWNRLWVHRMELRVEQRAALLAYGYLRGRAYRQIEQAPCYLKAPFCRPGPNWGRVRDLVWKYGPPQGHLGASTDKAKEALWHAIKAWAITPLAKTAEAA